MNCEEFKDHVMEYISHQIDPDLKERMEDHYFECDECFDELELMNAAMHELADSGLDGIKEWETAEGKVKWLISEAQEYLDQGDKNTARLHYEKAKEIKPDDERVKQAIYSLDHQALIDEFVVTPMDDVDREPTIPEAHVIASMLRDAQGLLDAGKLDSANGLYLEAQGMAFEIPKVESTLLSLQDQQEPIEPDETEMVEGEEVKVHSEENKIKIAQRNIDLLLEALKKLEFKLK
jgi:tetratricopeptide (TPR) repeat protein